MVLDCLLVLLLSGTSLLLSLATAITRKSFKTVAIKQEKHDAIKLLAQRKLDSIVNIISQAIQDGEVSPTEFHKVRQEVEKYRKLKADIRNQAKAKVKEITKEEILEQGRKEGKEDFLRKIANFSGTQGVSATYNTRSLRPRHVILWSIKTIKINLKFVFPVCGISFKIQHLTCPLMNHRITIHHDIFLKSLPLSFPHLIFHQPLIIYFLINDLLL